MQGTDAKLVRKLRPGRNGSGYSGTVPHDSEPAPKATRRRGETLERALYQAALDELTAVGYGDLTMEGIAARAHTGKAALYRRWSNKHDLVRAALRQVAPTFPEPQATKDVRENLLAMFSAHCDILAGKTAFPGMQTIIQLIHEPELRTIFAEAIIVPRLRMIESLLHTAERHGDIPAGTLTPLTVWVGPALINQHFLVHGEPPGPHELALVVDTVLPHGRQRSSTLTPA
ncbi:MAG: TetR/AcrR family transcriptional regulator [Mycobacteriaceae bacterium]|nr:TetR/AcrR family transcriptional regulator [Mycobacteriaceae bacterium]